MIDSGSFNVKGYSSSEHLRREGGLYYHLVDLFNKGELKIWEMQTIDKVFDVYLKEDLKNLEDMGLIDHSEDA